METLNNISNEICDTLLRLSKEENDENLKKFIASKTDSEIFFALNLLKNEANAKLDFIRAEYLAMGKGCKKSETEAGNLCAKIVAYLEKRNEFPPVYANACFMAASLLYKKVNAFELNLGFAIDYDRRGAQNGKSEKCLKRYEENIGFLKSIVPKKYPNEEMLYKAAAFVLSDGDKKQVTDSYWNTLKNEAEKIEKAYRLKYFSPYTHSDNYNVLVEAEKIIEENKNFPDENELYRKEEVKKTRPTLTAYGTKHMEFFTKISISYNEYEAALNSLNKTRSAAQRKEDFEEKLGIKAFEFWADAEKVKRALNALERKETYENIFGVQSPEFWEDDSIFFKYLDANSLREKYESILGGHDWNFWLDELAVKRKVEEHNLSQTKNKKDTKLKSLLRKFFKLKK